ncbi:MAG: glycoside hydrolase family 2 [Chloroflexia bacterium]|nr:glycoside hydrolase family 2 [Chloroflexia bacterium]
MLIERLADSPNPQFSRPGWVDLCGDWRFRFDEDDAGLREQWFAQAELLDRTIRIPFPPESELSGVNDKSYHPICWYARQFRDARDNADDRLIVNFGAVDYHATVWVDGAHVGEHTGGHTPFSFDVTDALAAAGAEHWLVVRAFDDPVDAEQPRGKQDWEPEPHVIWYHRTSGIWQPVWLETAPRTRVLGFKWTYDASRSLVDYEIELSQTPNQDSTLTIELEFEGEMISSTTVTAASRAVRGSLGLGSGPRTMQHGRLLWSPDRPNLIGATITLHGETSNDVVETYLGLRTIELSGRAFLINGRSAFLRFVLNQGYWPESQLAATSPAALKREVELILELGFNGARIHQKVEDPRFLYWADRLGLLLWGEMAGAFAFSERAVERHIHEWTEAVVRDRNHPSIVAWVPFNESWGISEVGNSTVQQQAVKAAYHRTHALDGTRPVVGNDGWENTIGDMLTIHDYNWDPEVLRKRYRSESDLESTIASFFPGGRHIVIGDFETSGKPVMVTEFGGVSLAPDADEAWFGYGKVRTSEEFVEQYRALTDALSESELLCGFCYTQLTDTEQETNGLLTAGRVPKAPIETLRAITRGNRSKVAST